MVHRAGGGHQPPGRVQARVDLGGRPRLLDNPLGVASPPDRGHSRAGAFGAPHHHGTLARPVTAFLIGGQGLSDRSHHREQPSGGNQKDSASNEHGRPFSGTTEQPQPGLGGPRAGCVRPAAGRRFVMTASNAGRSVGAPSWNLVLDIHLESVLNAATGCAGMTALR